jgi:hypothetical protein
VQQPIVVFFSSLSLPPDVPREEAKAGTNPHTLTRYQSVTSPHGHTQVFNGCQKQIATFELNFMTLQTLLLIYLCSSALVEIKLL